MRTAGTRATETAEPGRHPGLASDVRRPAAEAGAWIARKERSRRSSRLARRSIRVSIGSTAASFAAAALVVATVLVRSLASNLPDADAIAIPPRPVSLVVTGREGTILGHRGIYHDGHLTFASLPRHLVQAFVAIEDQRFFRHPGIDPMGIARAFWANLEAGRIVEGGSTITQQLARNLFLFPDRTLRRKIQEAILALRLEARFSKQEILETYVNRVYFGAGAYGIEAAARTYFDKPASEVTLAEAAVLAGLVNAPTVLSSGEALERAARRGRTVLQRMRFEGFISEAAYRRARQALLVPRSGPKPETAADGTAPYLLDWIEASLAEVVDSPHGNLFVETTLDPDLQKTVRGILDRAVARSRDSLAVSQGAVVVLDNGGAVRAMVGGVDYEQSQFNRAVQARRQPGSAFKPFVYLTALRNGLSPDDEWVDRPIDIDGWRPANANRRHRGSVTLEKALALSINTVAVDLATRMGLGDVARTARALGIESPIRVEPSLALGTSEVTLLELTSAFAGFANLGRKTEPYAIERVLDEEGRVLYERQDDLGERVVDPETVDRLNDMLTDVVERGTGRRARLDGHQVAGKTGTSQDYRDAWFIGFTATHTTGVWVGNDDFTPMNGVTGGRLPAEIWHDVMVAAVESIEPEPQVAAEEAPDTAAAGESEAADADPPASPRKHRRLAARELRSSTAARRPPPTPGVGFALGYRPASTSPHVAHGLESVVSREYVSPAWREPPVNSRGTRLLFGSAARERYLNGR